MITRVTITGADDGIDPQKLADLSKQFPFVEWGILFSINAQGKNRFPSIKWVDSLLDKWQLNLSAHLCGAMVRRFLKADFNFWDDSIFRCFQRVQINTHGDPHEWSAPGVYEFVKSRASMEFIFQYDNVNTDLIEALARHDDIKNISTLFDMSHGAGLLPEDGWPKHLDFIKCGYAGGLGPDNLATEIPKIIAAADGKKVWIDMETHVRTTEDKFDEGKVLKALEICSPFVRY